MAGARLPWSKTEIPSLETFADTIGVIPHDCTTFLLLGVSVLGSICFSPPTADAVRIKDIGVIEGVRENQLLGYGLVVGLDSTGDRVIGGQFTIQAMMSMLNKMGVNLVIDPIQLLTRTSPGHGYGQASSILKTWYDVGRSRIIYGERQSLQGGTLLLTPLKAANQQVFAVAQGPVSIGGF